MEILLLPLKSLPTLIQPGGNERKEDPVTGS